MSALHPIVSLPEQGPVLSAYGAHIYFKAKTEQTNGLWSVIEYHLPPSPASPPPHYHKVMQEVFYVLEGALQFTLDGKIIDAPAGTLVMVPPMAVHTFKNALDAPARFLIWFSPGGFEQYFLDMEELVKNEPSWPPSDMGKVFALMAEHDTFPPEN